MLQIIAILAIAAGWALSSYPLCGYWVLDFLLGLALGLAMIELALRRPVRQKQTGMIEGDSLSLRASSIILFAMGAMQLYPLWLILRDTALRTTHPALASQGLYLLGMGIAVTVRIGLRHHSEAKL